MTQQTCEPVRLGVIGAGNFGRLHALTAHALGDACLVAVVDPRPECRERIRELLPEVPTWAGLDSALKESTVEAWIVASTTATHVSAARQVLERGRPVLIEKPLAESVAEASSLAPLVPDDSRNLMMGHILLFNTELRQLMDEVRRRGPVVYLDSVRHRPVATMDLFPGESPLHLLMVHDLYATMALVGRAEPVRFRSTMRRNERGACDLAVAELTWPDGTLARYSASFLTPAGMSSDGFDRLEVFGTGWAARIQPNPRPIEVWDERAHWPMALEIRADRTAPSGMLAEELRCFCRVVRGVEPVPVGATYADAMQIQGWLERLEKAAANA